MLDSLSVSFHDERTLLPNMRPHVEIQMTALFKPSSTHGAFKRLDVCMGPHMLPQMNRLGEAFAANDAFEWLYFRVRAQMLVQARFLREGFWTEGAAEGSDPGVHSHVLL